MDPYVLTLKTPKEIVEVFKRIGVDLGGVDIMRRKGFLRCIKLNKVSCFSANILKQEMLSLGGDVALSRGTLTGKDKYTDCLLIGNSAQISNLIEKLRIQPFGLSALGKKLKTILKNFEKAELTLSIGSKKVIVGQRSLIMGIINVTPDSFSGDGILSAGLDCALERAVDMVDSGADIIDVGGESSRPGSKRIAVKEELARVMPVLKKLVNKVKVPVSIDTVKSEVAHKALDLGVAIVNDISALRFDKKMAKLIARYNATVVLMHMQGQPNTMQTAPKYEDVIGEIINFLDDAIKRALDSGIKKDRIIIDPGIGFGKTLAHNLDILNHLESFKGLGRPVLVGLSRKRFIGSILNNEVCDREFGTSAALSIAIANGADILRVHNVKEMVRVAKIADAITKNIYAGRHAA